MARPVASNPADISREPDPSEAAQRASARERLALSAAHAGIWVVDLTSECVQWSETMDAVMGCSREQFGGTIGDLLALVHPEDRDAMAAAMRHDIGASPEFEIEVRVTWPDGSVHWMQSRGRFILDDRGQAVEIRCVALDVTERRQLETQLGQIHKMAAIGRVAGGVAHDFNNILTAILGFALFIEDEPIEERATRAYAVQIRKAAERAAMLVRQLLAFSRGQVISRKVVQLPAFVSGLMPMLAGVLGEQIDVVQDFDDTAGSVLADPSQLELVVLTLAVNARDAMPGGGRLMVRVANVRFAQSPAAFDLEVPAGDYAMLEVIDTGAGMDAATRAQIFEPYFTTKPMGQGTGLSLATVYGIVKQMGGGISVKSQPGQGTTVQVCFPTVQAPVVRKRIAAPGGRGARGPRGAGQTVLLLEDEEPVRTLVSTVLARNGYTVLSAGAVSEAHDVVKKFGRPVDIVVSDVMMPDGDGRDLMAALKVDNVAPPALYISGYAAPTLAREGKLDANSPFLQKPFTHAQLLEKIREVLDLVAQ